MARGQPVVFERIRLLIRRVFVELGVFSAATNVLMLVMPLYMLQIYDRVLASRSMETLLYLSIIAGAALLVLGLLEIVRGIYASRVAARLDMELSPMAIRLAMISPQAAMGDTQPLRDVGAIRSFIGSRTAFVLFDAPFAPLFIAILYFIHPDLFWLTLVGAVVLALLALLNQLATSKSNKDANESGFKATHAAQALVRSSEAVRVMGMSDNVIGHWGAQHGTMLRHSDRGASISAILTGVSRFMRMGLQIAVLGYGGYLVLINEITPGMIFASSILSGRALQPVDQLIGSWKPISDVLAAWRRIRGGISSMDTGRNKTDLPAPAGHITVEGLAFTVENSSGIRYILKGISFQVAPGILVAIVGSSGAGKSTLLRLLCGGLEQRGGIIRIDGSDLRNWDQNKLGRHLGYLPQDVELLPGTVAQNISRFDPQADDEAIRRAAERAQVSGLVKNLAQGFDTPVGPGATQLSGGEKQRIGLARAFYGDPKVLILDEPNANLDREGDRALEMALNAARSEKVTVLVATQRTSVLEYADAVLELNDGAIRDYGPVKEVAARARERIKAESAVKPTPPTGDTRGNSTQSGPTPVPKPVAADKSEWKSRTEPASKAFTTSLQTKIVGNRVKEG
ncbi:type I secretion system permease/ATPase [Hoeflea sp.]|uniref:type I secretion system permease/ATPase n=1 Tax=Hoeflea sp. TaxID=1940281 RepID=UPI0019B076D9|nr:type I secretion system permease/ATPase [Hoeflea sp.]MBC7280060.1 type I secretion system permease/ATPase [Hoeflea sp.]